jgi:hypothetical protein
VRWLLILLVIYAIIELILLAIGLGIGFLLRWLIPSIDLGMGMLIGIVATGFSALFFSRITSFPLPDFGQDMEPEPPEQIVYVDPLPVRHRSRRRRS